MTEIVRSHLESKERKRIRVFLHFLKKMRVAWKYTLIKPSFYTCKHVLGVSRVPVIPDVLEQVKCLLESVGLIVLSENHVITAAGYHENDGRHICNKRESVLAYTLNKQSIIKLFYKKIITNYKKLIQINKPIYWPD